MKVYPNPLIKGAMGGNKEDFSQLLECCMRDVIYLAALHSNQQDAEDIAQEVAIILQRKIHTLSDPNRFSQWLSTVVRNASISYMRKSYKSKNNVELEVWMESEEGKVDQYNTERMEFLPERYVEDTELCNIVMEEIGKLPKSQKICLSYHYLQEFKRSDIVEVTEFNPAQVANALYNGKKTLKQRLEKRLGETLVFSVLPVGALPGLSRVFQRMQAEMVPMEWCEHVLEASLAGSAVAAASSAGAGSASSTGMSTVTQVCIGIAACAAVTVGVAGTVWFLGSETPAVDEIYPPTVIEQEEPITIVEPSQDIGEIRTIVDMIGQQEADVLEQFVNHVEDVDEWRAFLERIDAEEYERAHEYRDTYVIYILEKQNKRLLLAEHDSGDGEIAVLYLFGSRDEPVEIMARIILRF